MIKNCFYSRLKSEYNHKLAKDFHSSQYSFIVSSNFYHIPRILQGYNCLYNTLTPCVWLFSAEVQQLLEMKEDHPEWGLGLDQQDRESLQIKEEQEELWTNQEGEQHNGLKVTDVTTFPFTIVTVKSEDDDKEKSQSLQLHQSQTEDNNEMEPLTSSPAKQVKTEPDEEDCGGPESKGNLDTHIYLQPKTDVKASDSSETEVSNDDDDDWKEPVSDSGPKTRHSDDIWKVSRELESGIRS